MKMTKNYDKLNDVFNVSSEIVEDSIEIASSSIPKEPEPSTEISLKNDIKKDYEYTRGNLYSIIEKGQEAIRSN